MKEREYVIYCATNIVNNKRYIGQSCEYIIRKNKHLNESRYINKPKCPAFHSAIRKYGVDSFQWDIIAECSSVEEANELEILFIDGLNTLSPNGYNLQAGGLNHACHPDTKIKLSIAMKRDGTILSNKGKDHPNWGRKYTAEELAKQSERMSGENGPGAKLTEDKVKELYLRAMTGATPSELTKEFGLQSKGTVSDILNKKSWKETTKDFPNLIIINRGNNKLKENQVIDIINKAKELSLSQYQKCIILAEEYNVSNVCIYDILRGRRWKHLPR